MATSLLPEFKPEADLEPEIDWSALPSSLTEIKEVAGAPAALALAAHYGGSSLYVPRTAKLGHPLTQLLGREAAAALAASFGGDRIDIPKRDAILRQFRFRNIQAAREKGATITALATQHGLSRRRVLQLLAQA